jgi:hypothetical protein
VEQAAEYMAENPDAGAPTEESDAPLNDRGAQQRGRRLSNRVNRRLSRRQDYETNQVALAEQWRSQNEPRDDTAVLQDTPVNPAEMMPQ